MEGTENVHQTTRSEQKCEAAIKPRERSDSAKQVRNLGRRRLVYKKLRKVMEVGNSRRTKK